MDGAIVLDGENVTKSQSYPPTRCKPLDAANHSLSSYSFFLLFQRPHWTCVLLYFWEFRGSSLIFFNDWFNEHPLNNNVFRFCCFVILFFSSPVGFIHVYSLNSRFCVVGSSFIIFTPTLTLEFWSPYTCPLSEFWSAYTCPLNI